jgi:FKBP-type peptidyl-prolyl cis-trans isomerase
MYKYILAAVAAVLVGSGVYCVVHKRKAHSARRVKSGQPVNKTQKNTSIAKPIKTPQEGTKMEETKKNEFVTLDSGLKYLVLNEGSGTQAKDGDMATVHYTGWLYDEKAPEFKGQKFDSSVDRGQPFQFGIGAGMVIRGWDEGVALMKEGDKRTLILPAGLAYGSNAVGGVIPANATLVFDVELLKLN